MKMYQQRPCRGCRVRCYQDMECPLWQVWFLEAWDGVNRAGWELSEAAFRREQSKNVFRYALPHEQARYLRRSPCESCVCGAWCDRICSRYAAWWDARMAYARKKTGQEGT